MPLRKYFLNNIDKIFTITDSAKEYIQETYKFDFNILETARLGVDDNKIITYPTSKDSFHIVSCSYLIEVKRVDKIIEALYILANKYNTLNIQWTHMGSGPLFDDIDRKLEKIRKLNNIKVNLLGEIPNFEIYDFYQKNNVDVFINVSESEGVPVSIMEAMSCHIPIIAPDVGGVSDMLVDGYNGFLLSSEATVNEIAKALEQVDFLKNKQTRENSYELYLKRYNAKNNYINFINKLKEERL
jgi:glycosyltransferase involved in cell wall biosynthesis